MDISDKTKQIVESKAYFLELEKRLVNLESFVRNLSASGNLTHEQEERVAAVEDRLENVEDLQMVANLDLIRLKENLEKSQGGAVAQALFGEETPSQRKIEEIENLVGAIKKKVDEIESSKSYGKRTPAASGEEIKNLRKELDSFKKETEESVEIIVSSIKKMVEIIKR